jgi:hypothetical protein
MEADSPFSRQSAQVRAQWATIWTRQTRNSYWIVEHLRHDGPVDQAMKILLADIAQGKLKVKYDAKKAQVPVPEVARAVVAHYARELGEGNRSLEKKARALGFAFNTRGEINAAAERIAAEVYGVSVSKLRKWIQESQRQSYQRKSYPTNSA